MKVFPEVVRSLYDLDVLAEDTILHWFRKGTNTKGRYALWSRSTILIWNALFNKFIWWFCSCGKCCRQTFVKSLEPFVNWLEEAEEEEWVNRVSNKKSLLSVFVFLKLKTINPQSLFSKLFCCTLFFLMYFGNISALRWLYFLFVLNILLSVFNMGFWILLANGLFERWDEVVHSLQVCLPRDCLQGHH